MKRTQLHLKLTKYIEYTFPFWKMPLLLKKKRQISPKKAWSCRSLKKITMTRFFSLKTCFFFKQISKEPFDYIYIYDRCRHPENIFSNLAFVPTI